MIISATGHRPDKLPDKQTGYKLPNPTYIKICQETERILLELKPDKCITGMCQGYDWYFANVCWKLKIPFVAAVPFEGQELLWPESSQQVYKKLLSRASEVVIVSSGVFTKEKFQIRNEYLVNEGNVLLACFNGSPGGTANCIQYAKSIGREVIIINPREI